MSEWRRSWRSFVLLVVLVAFGGAITIASIAGARRADSAFDTLLDETSAPLEVAVSGTLNGPELFDDELSLADAMASIPGVEGVTPVSFMGVAAAANGVTLPAFAVATMVGAGERPPIGAVAVDGRLADPAAPDEVVINEAAADVLGVGVGDRVTLHTYAPDQADDMLAVTGAPFGGPRLTGDVVGVVRNAEDVSDNAEPGLMLTDAFRETYGRDVFHCDCSFWIRAAHADVAAVSAALPTAFGQQPLVVQPVDSLLSSRVEHAVGLEVGALRIAATVAALVAALVVAQGMARHLGAERGGSSTLVALGARRRDVMRAWTVTLLPVAVVGAIGAALGAIALSSALPRGLAREAVLHPGLNVDALAVVGGALAVVLVTVALARLVALVMVGRTAVPRRSRAAGSSRALVLRTRPTVALGASLALDPARDRARLAAVSAVSGLALAIGAVVVVGLIDVSTDEVLHTPASFAADWDMQFSEQPDDQEALIADTTAEPIEALALSMHVSGNTFLVTAQDRSVLASPGTLAPIVGSMGPFVERGRAASGANDVVLGPGLAGELGVGVGDRLAIDTGELGDQEFVVSGIGRLADGDDTDQAFFVTPDGLARMQPIEQQSIEGAYLRLGDAGDGVRQRLADLGWVPSSPPSSVANLGEIGSVPRLLAFALCLLGLGGATHSLLVAGRKRRHDLAVATSLGFTRRQVASAMRWQGIMTAGAAILVGLPLGVLVGRLIWKQVAVGVGAVDLVSMPWSVMVAVPFAMLLVVGAIAALVGHRTSMLDPARSLRGE